MSKRAPGAHAREAMLAAQGRLDDVDVAGILAVSGHPQPAHGGRRGRRDDPINLLME
jgi:hypothetical protein